MDDLAMKQAMTICKTPFYVFDTDVVKEQIEKIKSKFSLPVSICYAMKANPFVIGDIQDTLDYFEVCSMGEFRICQRRNIPMNKIVLSGVYKAATDITMILDQYGDQILYTVESLSQWNMIRNYKNIKELSIHVLLRLTTGNQFGVDRKDICQMIMENQEPPLVHIIISRNL